MSEFKVGDYVQVVKPVSPRNGTVGLIQRIEGGLYKVTNGGYFMEKELRAITEEQYTTLALATEAPPADAPAVDGVTSIFDGIERRIMKSGGVRFLEGIDEPIGLETARYINNQSMALHNANKVAETLAADAAQLRQQLATSFKVGQVVILLDGTSLVGVVIDVNYKVTVNGSSGRWYRADELAVLPATE